MLSLVAWIFLKTKEHSLIFLSYLFSHKCTVGNFFPLHTGKKGSGLVSKSPVPPACLRSVLLQLLCGKILLQVTLIAWQWQAVCDTSQERYWPAVLFHHFSGLFLHMHWVAGRESGRTNHQMLSFRLFKFLKCWKEEKLIFKYATRISCFHKSCHGLW